MHFMYSIREATLFQLTRGWKKGLSSSHWLNLDGSGELAAMAGPRQGDYFELIDKSINLKRQKTSLKVV